MTWQHEGSRHDRGYGRRWQQLRQQVLQRDGFLCWCPDCLGGQKRVRPADAVDHIVPKAQGGTDALSNLRAIASGCHRKVTALQRGFRWKQRIGPDGYPVGDE